MENDWIATYRRSTKPEDCINQKQATKKSSYLTFKWLGKFILLKLHSSIADSLHKRLRSVIF